LFANLEVSRGRLNELLEIEDLIMQENKGVFDLKSEVTDPRVLVTVVLLANAILNVIN